MLKGWAILLSLVLAACGDEGEAEPHDCDQTLEEWCGDDGCEDFATVDDALSVAMTDFEHGELPWVQACGDYALAGFSDGSSGIMYFYDLESGELIGGRRSSDIASDDACEEAQAAAGEEVECHGSCQLVGTVAESELEVDACEGELAEPLAATCLDDPPSFIEGCEECACAQCYPPLLAASDQGIDLNGLVAARCIADRCPDECEAQLAALEARQ